MLAPDFKPELNSSSSPVQGSTGTYLSSYTILRQYTVNLKNIIIKNFQFSLANIKK